MVPLPLATALFAAVHPGPRAAAGAVAAAVGLTTLVLGVRRHPLPRAAAAALGLAGGAVALGALMLLPTGPGPRGVLLPGLAPVVDAVLARIDETTRPLAVDAPAALAASTWAAAMLALAAGTAATARTRRRSLRLAWAVVGTAVASTALGLVQRATGAAHVYWTSRVPLQPVEQFFGTFVNPNHAGTLLAAATPLALVMAARRDALPRALGIAAAAACVGGVLVTASRGAVLGGVAGVAVAIALAAPRRVGQGVGLAALVGAAASAVVGWRSVAEVASRLVEGDTHRGDVLAGRLEVWGDALQILAAAPLLGVGPGGFDAASRWAKDSARFTLPRHAHSEPLQLLAEAGLVGGGLWLVALGLVAVGGVRWVLGRARGRRRTLAAGWLGAATALAVVSSFDYPLRIGALSILAAQVTGVLAATAGRASAPAPPRLARLAVAGGALAAGVGVAGLLAPALDRLAPHSVLSAGAADLEIADEQGRHARDFTLLEIPEEAADHAARARAPLARRLRASPLDAQPLMRLGRLELETGDLAGAVATDTAGTLAWPTLPWHWFNLAVALDALGDRDAARSAWRAGLALNLPDNDSAEPWLRRALASEPDPAAAVDALLPDRADRLRLAAVLLARDGQREAAERLFARGTALDPITGVAWARWLLAWGEPEAAWERVSGVADRTCQTWQVRGEVLLALDRAAEARDALGEARAVCPRKTGLDRAWVMARVRTGDPSVEADVDALLAGRPDDHGVRRAWLEALRRDRRWAETAPHLQALVAAGVATPREVEALERAARGLPPR